MGEWVRGVGRNRGDQSGEVVVDEDGQGGGRMVTRPEEREGLVGLRCCWRSAGGGRLPRISGLDTKLILNTKHFI